MKKILLIPALMLSVSLMANDYNYEITPVIGYNFQENKLGLDDATLYGAEFQYNGVDTLLKPELSVLYSDTDYSNSSLSTDIYRIAINGVYEYDTFGIVTPIAKIGIGYETINSTYGTENSDGAFLDAGVGAKIKFAKNIALKLEAVYMLKHDVENTENNLALLAGFNFSFGEKAQREPEPISEPVDGDDDNDGVLNSVDQCPSTPAGEKVDTVGCKIDGDDDNDGVLNSVDQCTSTPAGEKVDDVGCKIDGDDDNDGVLNSVDQCPTTPSDKAVDTNGCMLPINLNINFKSDSSEVENHSDAILEEFADYLKVQSNYSAKIIGHTDSTGSEAYNKALSQKRAEAVKSIIVEKGVNSDRITTNGMGEDEPIADNATKDGRSKNRRIEATLHKE